MKLKNETRWLCENARILERYSGRWVVFNADQGVVGCHTSLDRLLDRAGMRTDGAFVLHVPGKRELDAPFSLARKK